MSECFGQNFILNGAVKPAGIFNISHVYEGDSIYEIIRIVDGTPLFFHDHMERLATSVTLQGKELLADVNVLKMNIRKLIITDGKKDANLKIVFNYNRSSSNYLVYYIEPNYPTGEQYRTGVKGILFYATRNDPESKVINQELRSRINNKLMQEGAYEALLVNESNLVTEGSRSNIFFVKKEGLVTAPENFILSGITRHYILEICRERGINVDFECVNAAQLSEYDAVIMTGTSPMVLPFYSVNNKFFSTSHSLIESLRSSYILKAQKSAMLFRNE